jgi:UDP-4-amino-4,6-dideoxy-N-acetyl-beta-L-altrosamine transaminase
MARSTLLPYGRQSIDDDDVAAVVAQLRGDWLTQGPTVAEFERALCTITGAKYAVAVANGTAALHLASLAAGVGPGDTALVPDVTFVATANGVRYCGGVPTLVDVDPTTGLVDLAKLEGAAAALAARGKAPKAILPVSFAGAPPDLAAVRAIAERHGALVIEDAAHSLGATYRAAGAEHRSASCTHTDMAILSFHPVKHLTTGEGGAITTNDPKLHQALLDLRTHGITKDAARYENENDGPWYHEQQSLGFNYRITDLQCALGVSQAKKFPRFLERRRAIAALYDTAFRAIEGVRPLAVPAGARSAYHLYVLCLTPRAGESLASIAGRRKRLFLGLREQNIGPQVHYIPVHRQPDFRRAGLSSGEFPGAEAYYASCVSLPMFPAMTDADVADVVAAVRDVLAQPG